MRGDRAPRGWFSCRRRQPRLGTSGGEATVAVLDRAIDPRRTIGVHRCGRRLDQAGPAVAAKPAHGTASRRPQLRVPTARGRRRCGSDQRPRVRAEHLACPRALLVSRAGCLRLQCHHCGVAGGPIAARGRRFRAVTGDGADRQPGHRDRHGEDPVQARGGARRLEGAACRNHTTPLDVAAGIIYRTTGRRPDSDIHFHMPDNDRKEARCGPTGSCGWRLTPRSPP